MQIKRDDFLRIVNVAENDHCMSFSTTETHEMMKIPKIYLLHFVTIILYFISVETYMFKNDVSTSQKCAQCFVK